MLSTKQGSSSKHSKYWWDNKGGAKASSTAQIEPKRIDSAAQSEVHRTQICAVLSGAAGLFSRGALRIVCVELCGHLGGAQYEQLVRGQAQS